MLGIPRYCVACSTSQFTHLHKLQLNPPCPNLRSQLQHLTLPCWAFRYGKNVQNQAKLLVRLEAHLGELWLTNIISHFIGCSIFTQFNFSIPHTSTATHDFVSLIFNCSTFPNSRQPFIPFLWGTSHVLFSSHALHACKSMQTFEDT